MSKLAILGLGAMGSRMARAAIDRGHQVTVWNRTAGRAAVLQDAGARLASSPRQAVDGADFVFAMVRDDEASRAIWLDPRSGALDGMEAGAVAIESSTLSVSWVQDLAREAALRPGVCFLDAPVAGSRPQADSRQLIFLVGAMRTSSRGPSPCSGRWGRWSTTPARPGQVLR